MNKKAFTLIELIGVIVIITLIALVVFPIMNNTLSNNKEKAYKEQVKNLEKTAYRWSINNEDLLSHDDEYHLSFNDMINDGLIKIGDILNPKTSEPLEGCIVINWDEEYNQYEFNYDENCVINIES